MRLTAFLVFALSTFVQADGLPSSTDAWQTVRGRSLGSADAVKGGTFRVTMPSWPATLHTYGVGTNTYINQVITQLCVESLLRVDPDTLGFLPGLASHWRIANEARTIDFRIDPRARWADGTPITPADVVGTFDLIRDDSTFDPANRRVFADRIVSIEERAGNVVRFECAESDWRNALYIATTAILPKHEVGIGGERYRKEFEARLPAVSGPYEIDEERTRRNERLVLRRRIDYWGRDLPLNRGLYNFERIEFRVTRDRRIVHEATLHGDVDFSLANTAQWWVEAANAPSAKNGLVHRRKVFTSAPRGLQGLAFNTRRSPLDDVRVRKAIAHLFDRETMIEKFAYGEYEPLSSYFPGTSGENRGAEPVPYSPKTAVKLLDEAGWSKLGTDGVRTKDGERLSLVLAYWTAGLEKYHVTFSEAAKRVGVELKLERRTPEKHWGGLMARDFDIAAIAWGGMAFPNPRTSYHSTLADEPGTNNITGIKDREVDRLIEAYEAELDAEKRAALLRKLDATLFEQHPYALGWYLPCERFFVSARVGTPSRLLPRFEDTTWAYAGWWIDPKADERVERARETGAKLPVPPVEVRFED